MLISESILQSVGLSPLLFEVSLVLLRWYVEDFMSCDLAFFLPKTKEMLTMFLQIVDNPEKLALEIRNGPSRPDLLCISSVSRFSSPSC